MRKGRFVAIFVAAAGFFPAALLVAPLAHGRNLVSATGNGSTYDLLQSSYSIEVPDCGHMVSHITEEMDRELGKYVFVFHTHVAEDNDRCMDSGRQRTEIRARAADIIGSEGATLYYRWKFKLPAGFQASSDYTHIFEIKSDLALAIMTLTARQDQLGIEGRIGMPAATDLARFLDVWVVASLKILYADAGRVELTIQRMSDGEVLFAHAGDADTWDQSAGGHDVKFGIFRGLATPEALRDERIRFADLCGTKESASDCEDPSPLPVNPPDPLVPELPPQPEPEPMPPAQPPAPRPMEVSGGCGLGAKLGATTRPSGGWAVGILVLAGLLGRRRRR